MCIVRSVIAAEFDGYCERAVKEEVRSPITNTIIVLSQWNYRIRLN